MFDFLVLSLLFLQPVAEPQRVDTIVVEPKSERSFVLENLPVRMGEAWRGEYVSLSQRFLRATERYENIEISWAENDSTVFVKVDLFEYFKKSEWVADKPPKADDVVRLCVRESEIARLSQNRINSISQCIQDWVRARGYLDAQAFVYSEDQILKIDLSLGEPYLVSSIQFDGSSRLKRVLLRGLIENKEGTPYQAFEVKNDTHRIFRFYLNRGFYLAEIFQPSVVIRPDRREVELAWKIEEGVQYDLKFEGDFSSPRFIEELKESEERPPEWFIDDVRARVREELLSQGFLDAEVEVIERSTGSNSKEIRFVAARGRQYILNQPQWVGLLEAPRIQKLYDRVDSLREGRRFYEEKYQEDFKEQFFQQLAEAGYLDVNVKSLEFLIDRDSKRVTPLIYMTEGERRVIDSFEIEGVPEELRSSPILKTLRRQMEPGKVFNLVKIREVQRRLVQAFQNKGYLDASIDRTEEKLRDGYAYTFVIRAGPRYRVEQIIIKGLERTKISVLQNELLFNEGDFYDRELIDDTVSEILRLGISRSVDVRIFEKIEKEGIVFLIVEVFEAARFRFEVGPGFGTADGVRGVFRGTYANIGGDGRRLSLFAKANRELAAKKTPPAAEFKDGDVQEIPFIERRVTLEYFEPRIYNTPIDGRIAVSHRKDERRDFAVLSNSAVFGFNWRLSRNWDFIPEYKIEYSNPFNVSLSADRSSVDDAKPSRLTSASGTLIGTFVDDIFSPTKGVRSRTSFEFFDKRLGGDRSFWLARFTNDVFYPILELSEARKIGFAVSFNFGFSKPFGSGEEVPVEKRFRVGGENSVRGYGEDAIVPVGASGELLQNGGLSQFYFRSELNLPVVGDFDLLAFFDGGNIYESFEEFNPIDLRYGIGAGVRFNTAVGPVKVGYAFVVDQREGESPGQIYFGIGPL